MLEVSDQIKSTRLRQLVTMDNEAFVVDNEDVPGLFPANFKHELAKFNDLIAWKTV